MLFVQVKEATAEAWLQERRPRPARDSGRNRQGSEAAFVRAGQADCRHDVDIQHDMKTVHNVAAYLPGETEEYVVIGAHYDHLGLGDEHSLAPSQIGTDSSRRGR